MGSSNKPVCSAPAHPGQHSDDGSSLHCPALPLCWSHWGHNINLHNSILWGIFTTSTSQMAKVRHRELSWKKLAQDHTAEKLGDRVSTMQSGPMLPMV